MTAVLSGKVYVAANYRHEPNVNRDAAGNPEPAAVARSLRQVRVAAGGTADPTKCDHSTTICTDAECVEAWMLDWVLYFYRTVGGRTVAAGAPFDVMAHERALHAAETAGQNRTLVLAS